MTETPRSLLWPSWWAYYTCCASPSVFYAALPSLEALAVASGENVALARFDVDAQKLVYTHKVEGTHPIRLDIEIGAQRNLYSSNGGRVILAHQSDEWIDFYFRETELKAYTAHTIADPKLLWEEIRKIRKQGVTYSIEEMLEGAAGFAAPIYDAKGRLVSVLVITSVAHRARRNKSCLLRQAKHAAEEISGRLGYVPATG